MVDAQREVGVRRCRASWPALGFAAAAIVILLLFWRAVGFSTFTSDPHDYWAKSLEWRTPFDEFHVAGFPLLIALVRGITFDVVPPSGLMTAITGVALLFGVAGTYCLATSVGLSSRSSVAAATAFGIWPFVGAVYAAFPVADPIVLALMVWAAVWAVRGRAAPTGLLLGLAAVTHKSLWPAIALMAIAAFVWDGRGRRFGATVATLAAAPVAALWIAGIAAGHSVQWLSASSADDGIEPLGRNSLPVFDGLVGSVIYGDWLARGRALVVFGIFALALVVFLSNYRRWRETFPSIATIFSLQILGLALVMNQHLVWSCVRFSGLLAVPAVSLVATRLDVLPTRRWHRLAAVIVIVLIATQVLTAWDGADRNWVGRL